MGEPALQGSGLRRGAAGTAAANWHSHRLFAAVMAQAAHENRDLANGPLEHALRDPRDLCAVLDIDDRGAMFRRRPRAQLVADNLNDFETEKQPVVDVGTEQAVEFRFNCELLDFR